MDEKDETLKTLEATLETYRRNVKMVPRAELEGKYRNAFSKLKDRLASDVKNFMGACLPDGLVVKNADLQTVLGEYDKMYARMRMKERIGRATFVNSDIEEIKSIACELSEALQRLYNEYAQKYLCLYAPAPCFRAAEPQRPALYNPLNNKILNGASWETPKPEAAVIIELVGGVSNEC